MAANNPRPQYPPAQTRSIPTTAPVPSPTHPLQPTSSPPSAGLKGVGVGTGVAGGGVGGGNVGPTTPRKVIGSTASTPLQVPPTTSHRNSLNFSEVSGDVLVSSNLGAPRYTTTPTKIPPSSSTPRLDALESGGISSPQLGHVQMPRSFSLPQQMNMAEGRVEDALPESMVIRSKLSSDEVPADENGLKTLMRAGSWRSVLRLADRCIASSQNPQHILQFKFCKAVSLTKTRNYKNALDEINAIGDFNDPANCFETYTALFPGKKGSMVPFSLLILKAELLYVLGTDQSLDPLYNLLSYCRREIERLRHESSSRPASSSPSTPAEPFSPPLTVTTPVSPTPYAAADDLSEAAAPLASLWRDREKKITLLIATHLVAIKEYLQALTLVESLAASEDVAVLTSLGRIHLQLGCLRNAQALFDQVAKKTANPNASPLVLMNRGYTHLANDEYGLAIESFDAVLQVDPSNIAAANNRSICWLYTCELAKAIASLEGLIQRDPENNLDESLIFNLCTLYDLASDRSTDKKKSVMALVAKFAPDSFDFRVFKVNS